MDHLQFTLRKGEVSTPERVRALLVALVEAVDYLDDGDLAHKVTTDEYKAYEAAGKAIDTRS